MTATPLTDENIAIFREMWTGGVSIKRISQSLHICGETVHAWVKRLNLPVREQFESPWTEETTTKMLELRAQGVSATEIGKRLGFTKGQVIGRWHRLDVAARTSKQEIEGKPMLSMETLFPGPVPAPVVPSGKNANWPSRDAELTTLYRNGLSWDEITQRMGVPKKSVVARATALKITEIKAGDTFGESKVLSEVLPREGRFRQWVVLCPCGNERPVYEARLKAGGSTVCRACASRAKLQHVNEARARAEKKPAVKKTKAESVTKRAIPARIQPVSERQDAPIVRVPEPPPPAFQERVRMIGTDGCRFPFGTPRTASFRFCGEKPVRGRPYCEACLSRAYITQVREAA